MPIPTSIDDLDPVAAANYPAGSDSPTEGDNALRALSAIIRQEHDANALLASASTATVGAGLVGYDAANAYLDGTVGEKLNQFRSVDDYASTAAAIAAAVAGDFVLLVSEDLTVNIPTDAATMQIALDRLSPANRQVAITINFETGHAPTDGALVQNGDYGQFTITSVDATVTLSASWPGPKSILRGINAVMPTLDVFFDCGTEDVNTTTDGGAIAVETNSSLRMLSGAGATGGAASNTGLFVYQNSKVTCAGAAVFTDFTQHNLWITHASVAYLPETTATGAGENGCFVSRGSTLYAIGSDFSDAGSYGALVYRSRLIAIPSGASTASKFNNCGLAGIQAEQTSQVSVGFRNVAVQIHDALTHGIVALTGSQVDATGADFDTIASDAIRCTGAFVDCHDATFASVTRDVVNCGVSTDTGGGEVNAGNITANSAGRYGLYAGNGGRIAAAGATVNGATTAALYAVDGGYISAPSLTCTGAVANALLADGGEIVARGVVATGAGVRGALARKGSRINIADGDLSGATTGGARAESGSHIVAINANLQSGGSPAVSDCQIVDGSTISFDGGTGGVSTTVNTLTTNGIIFQ